MGAGAATGSLTFGLLFAWAVRYAWVKTRGGGSVRSHWLLWLAVAGMDASIAMTPRRKCADFAAVVLQRAVGAVFRDSLVGCVTEGIQEMGPVVVGNRGLTGPLLVSPGFQLTVSRNRGVAPRATVSPRKPTW